VDGAKTAIVDTRAWNAFRAGHVPKALSQPLGKSFPVDAGSMIGDDEPIVLIVDRARLDEATRMLVRIGLDRIEGWFDAAQMEAYAKQGGAIERTKEIPIADIAPVLGTPGVFILDVRRPEEFSAGHIESATRVVHTRVLDHLDELPRDKEILVNCRSGARSARVTALLARHGFRATNLAGGFLAWPKTAASTAP